MRILLSTVAAAALMTSPALAQTLDPAQPETPGAADPMAPGGLGQLEQDLSAAGFSDVNELFGAEIYRSTYQGQDALVIIMDEELGGVAALDDQIDEPDATAAIPEHDMDDDLAMDPALPEDDDLAETPDPAFPEDDDLAEAPDPAFPEDDDLAEAPDPAFPEDDGVAEAPDPAFPEDDGLAEAPDPAFPEDDGLAEAPEGPALDEPDVTAAVPGVGAEDDLSEAGFDMPERTDQGQVFRTTTEDGRTMLIVLGYESGAGSIDRPEPGLTPEDPAMDPAESDLEEIE